VQSITSVHIVHPSCLNSVHDAAAMTPRSCPLLGEIKTHWHVTLRLLKIEWVQVKMEMPVAPGMVAPLDGTPDDQGLNGTSEGGKKNKSGGPRRKVGRWSEEETNTLISLTNQVTKLHESSFPGSCVTRELLSVKSTCTQYVQLMHNHASIWCHSNVDCLAGGFLLVDQHQIP